MQDGEPLKYDIILTSDTLYNETYYHQLISLIQDHLSPQGTVFVAAKSYYFGLGGSVSKFMLLLDQSSKLYGQIIKRIEDRASNVREVLQLTFKHT